MESTMKPSLECENRFFAKLGFFYPSWRNFLAKKKLSGVNPWGLAPKNRPKMVIFGNFQAFEPLEGGIEGQIEKNRGKCPSGFFAKTDPHDPLGWPRELYAISR